MTIDEKNTAENARNLLCRFQECLAFTGHRLSQVLKSGIQRTVYKPDSSRNTLEEFLQQDQAILSCVQEVLASMDAESEAYRLVVDCYVKPKKTRRSDKEMKSKLNIAQSTLSKHKNRALCVFAVNFDRLAGKYGLNFVEPLTVILD